MMMTREHWLLNAVDHLRLIYQEHGYTIPEVRISCGLTSGGIRGIQIGECWAKEFSADGLHQIFIHPILDDPLFVLETIMHELVHVVDNCTHGHGKQFEEIALKVGLEGEMRLVNAGEQLIQRLQKIVVTLGPYPHVRMLILPNNRFYKPRAKAKCAKCGYQITLLKKWLHLGPPICPVHKIAMQPLGEWDTSS
jgi:hypothetical protein